MILSKAHSTLNCQSINMGYKCDECDSTFREKKNLQQHRRKEHGLKNISVIIVISIQMIEAMY